MNNLRKNIVLTMLYPILIIGFLSIDDPSNRAWITVIGVGMLLPRQLFRDYHKVRARIVKYFTIIVALLIIQSIFSIYQIVSGAENKLFFITLVSTSFIWLHVFNLWRKKEVARLEN